MSGYTKGPWKAINNERFWEVATPWEGETEVRKYCPAVGYAWDVGEDTAKGNALLMAAAPELLEALKNLRSFMWAEGYADQTAEMAQADAAILKAEDK